MFFFFQAEDGIRDSSVTGVQTCALPIFIEFACRSPDTPANPFSREGCMRGFSQADRVLREAAEAAQVPGVVAVAATREGPVYQGAFGKRALPARPPPAPPTIVLVPPTPQPIPATPPTA